MGVSFAEIFKMRKLSGLFLTLMLLTYGCGETSKPAPADQPRAASKHSDQFNATMNDYLQEYYNLSEALVRWDTAAVQTSAATLIRTTDNLSLQNLIRDSAVLNDAKSKAASFNIDLSVIKNNADITQKRRAFDAFSEKLFDFLNTVKYDHKKLYLQQCPMAFEEGDKNGIWISEVDSIRNPYLGLYHPKYKSGMLVCGENKSTIDFQNK
jgi:hypothetical protein